MPGTRITVGVYDSIFLHYIWLATACPPPLQLNPRLAPGQAGWHDILSPLQPGHCIGFLPLPILLPWHSNRQHRPGQKHTTWA